MNTTEVISLKRGTHIVFAFDSSNNRTSFGKITFSNSDGDDNLLMTCKRGLTAAALNLKKAFVNLMSCDAGSEITLKGDKSIDRIIIPETI